MFVSVIIAGVSCLLMILGVLFFPTVKIGRRAVDTYWLIVLTGAVIMVLFGQTDISEIASSLLADTSVNPIKILVLFISMTLLSVFLDELGFFKVLADYTLRRAKTNQTKLFLYLYLTVSVLTVFTSNDVIILSFTPFICYFSKNAKISPIPYLAAEFVAANTWSMALIIGNPTNIYLATANGIGFSEYVGVMALPTLAAGIVAFFMLFLMFKKKLAEPISGQAEDVRIKDKTLLVIGVLHLAVCTFLLAIGSYIGIEMWLVSLFSVISLTVCVSVASLVKKRKPVELGKSYLRAPWQLIPFVLSMFVIILALKENGVTALISEALGSSGGVVFKYGFSSFLAANIINNIPMSVLFCTVIEPLASVGAEVTEEAIYATVIGSNIGAFLTPIGALAGIMWSSIIKRQDISFGYFDFLKMGVCVAIPTITAALLVLGIE